MSLVTRENRGRHFAANRTVKAENIGIEFTGNVFFEAVSKVSHKRGASLLIVGKLGEAKEELSSFANGLRRLRRPARRRAPAKLSMPGASDEMIVNHPGGLHVRVTNG